MLKKLRSKTYNDILSKISNLENTKKLLEEKEREVSILREKLKNPTSHHTNEGSGFCRSCKHSYTYGDGTLLFPYTKTGCTLNSTCEDFEMK